MLAQLQVGLHLLICPGCAQEVERFEAIRDMLRYDFLPPAPGLEDSIMASIAAEEGETLEELEAGEIAVVPGGISTRGWVIAGLVLLVSLATVFFGMEFNHVALDAGMSFLLPVGITVGIVLTTYGALFIGSHLKELKELGERFGL
jgi:anti-sigma factor ChrR (cupin superfamily)